MIDMKIIVSVLIALFVFSFLSWVGRVAWVAFQLATDNTINDEEGADYRIIHKTESGLTVNSSRKKSELVLIEGFKSNKERTKTDPKETPKFKIIYGERSEYFEDDIA